MKKRRQQEKSSETRRKKQEEIKHEDVNTRQDENKKSIFVNFSEFVSTLVKFDLIYFVSDKCFSTFLKIFLFSFLSPAQLLIVVSSFFQKKKI